MFNYYEIKGAFINTVIGGYIILFTYASTSKLLDYRNFNIQLGQSPILAIYADFIAWTIPLLELVIVILLCFEKYKFVGLYLAFVMMTLFTSYIIIVLNLSSYIPCSCGGILEDLNWNDHLLFNLTFLFIALAALYLMIESNEFRISIT